MARYVALLRGINVGGNNLIRMADLRACLEADGFDDVRTYIQSGNVVFTASGGPATLTERLERTLSAAFGYEATVAVRSARQFRGDRRRSAGGVRRRPRTLPVRCHLPHAAADTCT